MCSARLVSIADEIDKNTFYCQINLKNGGKTTLIDFSLLDDFSMSSICQSEIYSISIWYISNAFQIYFIKENLLSSVSKAVVPKLFGSRDQFCGRQFFHRWGRGVGVREFSNVSDGSGSNASNEEWWGVADEASLALLMLTSCCMAQFLTDHEQVEVLGPRVRDPWSKASRILFNTL